MNLEPQVSLDLLVLQVFQAKKADLEMLEKKVLQAPWVLQGRLVLLVRLECQVSQESVVSLVFPVLQV